MTDSSFRPARTPVTRGLERLTDGSRRLGARATRWVTADGVTDKRPHAIARRAALAGLGAWTAAQTGSGVLLVAVPAFAVAAWKHGTAPDPPAPEPEDAPDPLAEFVGYLRELIGDRPGIHLGELHEVLVEGGSEWDRPQLRAALDRMGIPVRQSVRIGAVVRTGIHRDDLPSPTGPPEAAEGEEPGQGDVERGEEGL